MTYWKKEAKESVSYTNPQDELDASVDTLAVESEGSTALITDGNSYEEDDTKTRPNDEAAKLAASFGVVLLTRGRRGAVVIPVPLTRERRDAVASLPEST